MMFERLSHKIILAMVFVSGLTILLASWFLNQTMDRQFVDFVEDSQQQLNQQIVSAVKTLYEQKGANSSLEEQLSILGAANNVEIVVVSPERQGHHGMMMGHQMGMNRRTTDQLVLPDGTEASIEIIPTLSWEQEDREVAFRIAINRSILLAALLSIAGAVVISAFFSWHLTKPLQQLTHMVQNVSKGNLQKRARLKGRDELTYLGQEFNQLAANLQKQEQLRIKLTNDMAHELRTPLASIQAYIEAMHDGVLEPSEVNFALVLEETHRLNGLLESLRELAKLETPTQSTKELVDLGRLISKVVRSLNILAEDKKLDVTWEEQVGIWSIGNELLLATALRNVILNAIKYTPEGGSISIKIQKEKKQAKIEVADTGVGIAKQELPYIFERFYRTDGSRSRETGGTGIGLAVTSEVIQDYGGSVEVKSEVDLGSVFTLYLPIANEKETAQ